MKVTRTKWNLEMVIDDAKNHSLYKGWVNTASYKWAYRRKVLCLVADHVPHWEPHHPPIKWTKELLMEDAKKYNSYREYWRKSSNAYHYALKRNLLEEITAHMIDKPSSWTEDKVRETANNCKYLKEFRETGAYKVSIRLGIMEEVTKHMDSEYRDYVNRRAAAVKKLEEVGIPENSPVGRKYVRLTHQWISRHSIWVTPEWFLSQIKITKPNGEEAEAYDPINKKWIDLLSKDTHLHHCHDFGNLLFFTEAITNKAMGIFGDTPFDFIELSHILISKGAKIPKDKLSKTKELIGKLYEAVNKMDSGLCDIVP